MLSKIMSPRDASTYVLTFRPYFVRPWEEHIIDLYSKLSGLYQGSTPYVHENVYETPKDSPG